MVSSVERDRSDLRSGNNVDDVRERERQSSFRESELCIVVVGIGNGFEAFGEFVGELSLLFGGNRVGEDDRPAFLHIVKYSLSLENCTEDSSVSREI